jgi:hypothetical protein
MDGLGNGYGLAGQVGASRPDELFMAHDTTRGAFAPPVQAPSKQRSTHGSAWRLERIKVRRLTAGNPYRLETLRLATLNPCLRFAHATNEGV